MDTHVMVGEWIRTECLKYVLVCMGATVKPGSFQNTCITLKKFHPWEVSF